MKKRPLGQSGIEASIMGVGTWAIGGWSWGGTDEAASIRAIHASLDRGINLIDTAPIYGQGVSEEIVGKATADRRDQAVIATKCGLRWDSDEGEFSFTDGTITVYRNNAPDAIRVELERSLTRLKTDVIDLYQTHWQESVTPYEETMAELLKMKDEGKIRAIGVSNVSVDILEAYGEAGPVDTIQEQFSMVERRHIEDGLIPYAHEQGVAMLAYSPLDMGLLTGKIGPERTFAEGDLRKISPRFSVESRQTVAALLADLQPYADELGLTIAQLVLAWSATYPGVTHLLCGARNELQAEENAVAASIDLDDSVVTAISGIVDEHAIVLPENWE